MSASHHYCAIDFGTSNSAVALPAPDGIKLVELEPGFTSIPTAVFFSAEDGSRAFGRAAVEAYVDGYDGRLMRSIKNILGSDLMDRATEVGLFARARCGDCEHDYFVAFSCKGRGVCPSCNTRRMVETAAHLTDHVFPHLPVRQWVLSVPKRLRYFMQRDGALLNMVLRIFLRVITQSLSAHCPGAANVDKSNLHIGAVAFIHRFCSSLNEHMHFHVCVVDGVFEEVAGGVIFHPAVGIEPDAVAQVQATLRRRILRAFVGRGLLESFESKEMLAYQHSGFSVDARVCIQAHDRAGLERLLRYCARPPFAMDRLRKAGTALVYRCAKQYSEPGSDKRGARVDELHLSPLELIDRIAALVPPPRTHRHRYFGVLAPNSPLRAAVAALAAPGKALTAQAMPVATGGGAPGPVLPGHPAPSNPPPVPVPPSVQQTTCGRC